MDINSNGNTNQQPPPLSLPLPPQPPSQTTTASAATNSDREKYQRLKEKLRLNKLDLKSEKERKQKLYKGLVKLASELKDTKAENEQLKALRRQEDKSWYEGGMWRAPELLPGIATTNATSPDEEKHYHVYGSGTNGTISSDRRRNKNYTVYFPQQSLKKEAVSLSDLFFDLVIVTAFTRVGLAIQDKGKMEIPQFCYFCIFWLIWGKEASFSTRFDTTDLSCQMETLFTCFAVLFGSLGSKSDFDSNECTSVMIVAFFVALLHFMLHLRYVS